MLSFGRHTIYIAYLCCIFNNNLAPTQQNDAVAHIICQGSIQQTPWINTTIVFLSKFLFQSDNTAIKSNTKRNIQNTEK
jgi:hypothetical protein